MRQAIIKNGVVTNICIGNAGGIDLPENSPVGIGYLYDGASFSAPPAPEIPIQTRIDLLEAKSKMNRFVREAMILISQQQAAALGMTEPQLYAANVGYRAVKDLDTEITLLRGQL